MDLPTAPAPALGCNVTSLADERKVAGVVKGLHSQPCNTDAQILALYDNNSVCITSIKTRLVSQKAAYSCLFIWS